VNISLFTVHVIASAEYEQTMYDVDVDRRLKANGSPHPVSGRTPLDLKESTEVESSSVATSCLPRLTIGCRSISDSSSTSTTCSGFTSERLLPILAPVSQPSTIRQGTFSSALECRIPTFVVDSVPDTPSLEHEASVGGPLSEYASAAAAGEAEVLLGCFDSSRLLSDADSGVSLDSDCASSYDASQKTSPGQFCSILIVIWHPFHTADIPNI